MIEFVDQSCRLSIHATPGARRELVGGSHNGALRVAVTAPADQGKANKAIIKALARALGVSQSQIELIRGPTSRRKVFAIAHPPASLAGQVAQLASIS
jgi:uncharacterized protein (TIGR00251 family)